MIILKGTNLLNDMALEMKEYATMFYGKEYKKLIDQVYEKTSAYEYTDNDTFTEILSELTGKKEEELDEFVKKYLNDINGFFIKQGDYRWFIKNTYNTILIKNDGNFLQMKENLCHELYGHSVCSINRPSTKIGGIYYFRNGIAYNSSDRRELNRIANEGFIELFATLMIQMKNPEYVLNKENYRKAVEVASIIYEIEGHEKLVDLMVKGKGDISKVFYKENPAEWYKLAYYLDRTIETTAFDDQIDEITKKYVLRKRG